MTILQHAARGASRETRARQSTVHKANKPAAALATAVSAKFDAQREALATNYAVQIHALANGREAFRQLTEVSP